MAARLTDEQARAVMLAADLEPLEPYPGALKTWRCRCMQCGAEVTPRYAGIQSGEGGCRSCGLKRGARKQRLPDAVAVAAMRAAKLEPLEPYPGSRVPWPCTCLKCGRGVTPTYGQVRDGVGGCKWCAGNAVDPDEARAMMLAAGVKPIGPYVGANEPWACTCLTCGHVVTPRYASIQQGQGACVWCARKRTENAEAEAVMVAAGVLPLVPYPGRHAPWPCECMTCGRSAAPAYGGVAGGQGACRYCSRVKVDPVEAEAVMRAANLEPLEPYPGQNKTPWPCRCMSCGALVSPKYNTIQAGDGGCSACSLTGLNRSAPGAIYLMSHEAFFALKIGVTGTASRADRIANHAKKGWHLEASWQTETGADAEHVEQAVLRWWRDTIGAPAALTRQDMKSGWSETASLRWVDVETTTNRIASELAALRPRA